MSRPICICRHFAWHPDCPAHPGQFVQLRVADELSTAMPSPYAKRDGAGTADNQDTTTG